ncbi:unnamed protein product [Rotaria sp. Silwood1]|nr:unnamed protein product [Rotaria sp. Silwood1]CAF1071154.1 unnamed protein product [Rotaria sp. Silwood1]CAF1078006.1 unnamed protein product [Rotaria sp. Silwood1]CAF3409775.1 unnamed protein product [Rotaria sp. Silwood1]CAF3437328.1 unnamed protein product [Rotaria sp. Silwood1]
MTTKGARIKSTTNTAPNSTVKKTDTVEPYHCKGKFLEDFEALCRQAQITYIVPIVLRPHPPGTPVVPSAIADIKDKAAPKTAKGAASKEREHTAVQQPSEADSGETSHEDSLPKTYSLRDNLEYFKPKIQVEMDNPEKQDTLTEILIRAWKIDRTTLDIFAQSFPTLERLATLHFWHTGLTDDTLKQLASILPKCPSIRTLILDANPIPFEHYDVLLTDENSPIINLSLRHCQITERGAFLIAQGLGTERRQNKKIQTLNLAYNSLGDNGAEHIARSLKFNRTLLVLNLSSNDISDPGAQKFAEVLSKFPLTEDELVYRRKLLLHSSISESVPSLPSGRRHFVDRRASAASSPTGIGRKKSGVTSTTVPSKGKGGAGATAGKPETKETAKPAKKDDKAAKKGATIAESKTAKGAAGKQSTEKLAKTTTNPKSSGIAPGNRSATQSEPDFIINDGIPLLDHNAELLNNDLVLPGNRCLLSLNLSKNRITDTGVQYILKAIQYQEMFIKLNISSRNLSSTATPSVPNQGLLRLELQRNDFIISECEAYDKVQTLLKNRREPIFKNKDNQDESATGGRDTVGTPHAKSRQGLS